jgi:hypothetical protein
LSAPAVNFHRPLGVFVFASSRGSGRSVRRVHGHVRQIEKDLSTSMNAGARPAFSGRWATRPCQRERAARKARPCCTSAPLPIASASVS